ncbi:MAG: hypothetical protein KH180_00005 [Anaerostipes sp.]|nr:hypothetical protein [Anaerostipes sp.]
MAKQGLLDFLAEKSGCAYLSELRDGIKSRVINQVLDKVDADSFSLKEWQDAVEYFTEEKENIQDQKSAKKRLKKHLSGKYSK